MDSLQEQVADLARRVMALEDELAIHRVIVTYGFAVDSGDADATAALYTADTIFDVDGRPMVGHGEVHAMVLGASHQSLLPNCAHTIGPAVVKLDGDRAVATGYSRIYHRSDDNIRLFRLAFNRWELRREPTGWQIARRTTRMVGHPEAQAILHGGVE